MNLRKCNKHWLTWAKQSRLPQWNNEGALGSLIIHISKSSGNKKTGGTNQLFSTFHDCINASMPNVSGFQNLAKYLTIFLL